MATRIHFVSFVAILAVAAVTLPDKADAAVYTVGNAAGWTVPAGGSSYAAWAANLTFKVGDSLVFNFPNGIHDVAKVTKSAYDNCNTTAPISLRTVGPASVILNSTGQHYFICTFSQHCPLGQKLAINVSTASTPPSPAPTPTPTPSPSSTPTPSPSSSSSPKTSPSPSQTPPTPTPSSSPVPTPTPTPGRGTPAPAPNGVSGGPPAPPPANTPGASSSPSGTPAAPQPPSSAPRRAIATLFVVAMSIVVGAMF